MKNHGQTRSTTEPLAVEVTASKVFVASNVEQITVQDQSGERTEYQYDLMEYEKDEYIKMMNDRNETTEAELTDVQLALCDVYELILG